MATTYKIGEAAALLNLKTYVLRFWETEFPEIVPLRTEKGQRLYTEEHLALLERIRYLLHERGLTIGGARRALAEEKAQGAVYVFSASSAVAGEGQGKPDGPQDPVAGIEETADAAAPVADAELEDLDGMDEDAADDEDAPLAPMYQAGGKERPQYNLPGLEQLVALSKTITVGTAKTPQSAPDSGPDNEFDDWLDDGSHGDEEQLTSPEAGPPAQNILPLFGMIRNALQTGTGGNNFIQAGSDSAQTAGPGTVGAQGLPGAEDTARAHAKALRLLVEELEQVARILRPGRPPDKPTGAPAGTPAARPPDKPAAAARPQNQPPARPAGGVPPASPEASKSTAPPEAGKPANPGAGSGPAKRGLRIILR